MKNVVCLFVDDKRSELNRFADLIPIAWGHVAKNVPIEVITEKDPSKALSRIEARRKAETEEQQKIAAARVKTGDFIARLMMTYAAFVAFCVFTLFSDDKLMILPKATSVFRYFPASTSCWYSSRE